MIYDGIVMKYLDEEKEILFLFILNPETNSITDGINISDHECYAGLSNKEMVVVTSEFKDGTTNIDNFNFDEFIYGESYGENNIFIYISDKVKYELSETLNELVAAAKIEPLFKECIENSKILLKEQVNEND